MVTRIAPKQITPDAAPRARKPAGPTRRKAAGAPAAAAEPLRERMSKVDTAWLRMDSSVNLMLIVGVWQLRSPIRYQDLCQRVQERLLPYVRFRQKAVEDATGMAWVEDTALDIERHVVREKLPKRAKGSAQAALQDRVAELAMEPIDHAHPLWQMHLVEHYEGGSALVIRIHHCIADGMALVAVTQSLADGGAAPPGKPRKTAPASAQDWIAESVVKPFTDIAVKALDAAGEATVRSLEMLRDPQQGLESSREIARLTRQVVNDAAALLLMPDDSPTRLKGKPIGRKKVAWCAPLPLDEVRAVAKALNCSINDVLLSCVAGAIGEYLRSLGDEVEGKEIRAMVPVNLRPAGEPRDLGNRFGLVPLVLPIGIENPLERVYEVRRRMAELKGSTQPVLAFLILAVAGLLMKPAQDMIINMFGRKTTAVMTNVPGPREKFRFLGSTLDQSMFWVPQSGDIGLGVSILSYGGGVQFGVIGDVALCPEPQKIIDAFEPEFGKLSLVTLMLPWGD